MLDAVHLRSFKCFDDLQLPLSPLMLLTGFNAAGKSTALQAILLLAQSLSSRRSPSFMPLSGRFVELGSFGEILNEHSGRTDRSLTIGVCASSRALHWTMRGEEKLSGAGMRIERVVLTNASGVEESPVADVDMLPPEASPLLADLANVVYLSAVRLPQTETFPSHGVPDPVMADVGSLGEFAPWWLSQHEADIPPERWHAGEKAPTLRRQVNAWLGSIFPGAETNAVRIENTSRVRLELRTSTVDSFRRPSNIGFGLSYAFPVVVALLLAKRGQTVILDSPEAHLHPSGQSAMGRMLAHFAAAGVQILVETHSDHVLNGVRRAVRGGTIPSEDATAAFFVPRHMAGGAAQVQTVAFDAKGNLSGWPGGFFDQADVDLASLAGWD